MEQDLLDDDLTDGGWVGLIVVGLWVGLIAVGLIATDLGAHVEF
jgi:hypothetical protein